MTFSTWEGGRGGEEGRGGERRGEEGRGEERRGEEGRRVERGRGGKDG